MTHEHHAHGDQPPGLWMIRPDVAVSGDDERVLVLPLSPRGATPMELIGVGLEIWRLIDGERELGLIVSELCRRFDADPATVADDVAGFLIRLEEAEVLERRPLDAGRAAQS